MNPWGLAFILLAIVIIIVGWRGSYGAVWQLVTGRQTRFGQSGGPIADPIAAAQSAAQQSAGLIGAGLHQAGQIGRQVAGLAP